MWRPDLIVKDTPIHIILTTSYSLNYWKGDLLSTHRGSQKSRADYDNIVLNKVQDDLSTSFRAIEQRMGIPKATTHPIRKKHKIIRTKCNVYETFCREIIPDESNFVTLC